MNTYLTIITLLKNTNIELDAIWENANWALNNSSVQSDINHYEAIKSKVNELQDLLNEQLKEME